jgi:hypothetical protein
MIITDNGRKMMNDDFEFSEKGKPQDTDNANGSGDEMRRMEMLFEGQEKADMIKIIGALLNDDHFGEKYEGPDAQDLKLILTYSVHKGDSNKGTVKTIE